MERPPSLNYHRPPPTCQAHPGPVLLGEAPVIPAKGLQPTPEFILGAKGMDSGAGLQPFTGVTSYVVGGVTLWRLGNEGGREPPLGHSISRHSGESRNPSLSLKAKGFALRFKGGALPRTPRL